VAIFGHSWGSALGVFYAARFPDKVAAYVGSGQIGDAAAGESASYAFALAEAQRLGRRRLIEKLRAIGPPPHSAELVRPSTRLVWFEDSGHEPFVDEPAKFNALMAEASSGEAKSGLKKRCCADLTRQRPRSPCKLLRSVVAWLLGRKL
jgi:pimeloyl-ACP methyl ester carboxylesterase